ncbi:MAG: hypothetical protein K2X31_05605 [Sphingopyxis sp.]|nr:hypothetical protein [Sphingopyxis sp.]
MAGIAILWPLPIATVTVSSGSETGAFLSTPSPREVWVSGHGSAHTIDLDLGASVAADLLYLGNTNLPVGTNLTLSRIEGADAIPEVAVPARLPLSTGNRCACVIQRPVGAPSARYFRIQIACPAPTTVQVANVCIGPSFRHAYAFSSGRQLIDTSRRADLLDGGFGVGAGVTKAAFKWRFVDLSHVAREDLWQRLRTYGVSVPIVVIESLEDGQPSEPSVHYGLFDRFEPWERANAVDTVWALSMVEWR